MPELKPIYWNFDNLDVTFQGVVPPAMLDALEQARLAAQTNRAQELLDWQGEKMHVAESGARGGYAYRCDTGPVGATWFFSRNQSLSGWNIRASVKSNALASLGLGRVRAELYRFLDAIGAKVLCEAISRVDYCMDFMGSDIEIAAGCLFSLNPTAFVMHSHTSRTDHEVETKQSHGVSGRYTSVTCGKMPGRQIIIYDKSKEIQDRQKVEWWKHWNASLRKNGRPPLTGNERIWRVEIRAGKRYLKDRWKISTWVDMDDRIGDLYARAVQDLRYTIPSLSDSGRFRWPLHPLWVAVRHCIEQDLSEMSSGADAEAVKEVYRARLASIIEGQLKGLLPTWVIASRIDTTLTSIPEALSAMVGEYLQNNPSHFEAGIERTQKKYRLLELD